MCLCHCYSLYKTTSSERYNLVAAVGLNEQAFNMTTAILPSKFEQGDFTVWLREYDACADANGWNTEAKI